MNDREKLKAMERLVAHKKHKWCDYCTFGHSCPLSFRGKFCNFELREDYDDSKPVVPFDNPMWTTN